MLVFTVAAAGSLALGLAAALAVPEPLSAAGLSRSEGRRTLVFFFLKNEA